MLTVRQVETDDRELLDEAAKTDPYHARAGLTGAHWADGNTLIWADDQGEVVALRTAQVVRVDIQFMSQDRRRNREALLEGVWKYVSVLQKRGVSEIIFNSNSTAVVNLFQKRFHFRHIGGDTYSLRIS